MKLQVQPEQWLDADQLAAWRGFMKLMQRLPGALEGQLQRDSQLSFLEYYVLALLAGEPAQQLRMSELADRVDCELSRLSHLMKRLETREFVRRTPDPENGRYTLAVLTDVGREHQAAAAPNHVARVREVFVDALEPEELSTLRDIAQKIISRIEES